MNLLNAPFGRPLRVRELSGLSEEVRLVLGQLGLDEGETVEKRHVAPLGDPVGLRIGAQLFTLRAEVCRHVRVDPV